MFFNYSNVSSDDFKEILRLTSKGKKTIFSVNFFYVVLVVQEFSDFFRVLE